MSDPLHDLEQQLMECWNVTDDIKLVTTHFVDDPKWIDMSAELTDALMNKYFAIQELYELKFQKAFETFELVCKEHHNRG